MMKHHVAIGACVVGALLSAGCGSDSVSPPPIRQVTELGGMRLEIDVAHAIIPVGDSGTVTMRLRNLTAEAKRIIFGSSCQIMPYIKDGTGAIRYPGGGAWGCAAIITSIDLPANGEVTRTLLIRGVAAGAGPAGAALPPGAYSVRAVLEQTSTILAGNSPQFQLRSPTISFEVR